MPVSRLLVRIVPADIAWPFAASGRRVAGSDTNGRLAVAAIGGMVSSTLLTRVVVPVVYSLVENGVLRLRARRAAGHPASA